MLNVSIADVLEINVRFYIFFIFLIHWMFSNFFLNINKGMLNISIADVLEIDTRFYIFFIFLISWMFKYATLRQVSFSDHVCSFRRFDSINKKNYDIKVGGGPRVGSFENRKGKFRNGERDTTRSLILVSGEENYRKLFVGSCCSTSRAEKGGQKEGQRDTCAAIGRNAA